MQFKVSETVSYIVYVCIYCSFDYIYSYVYTLLNIFS